MAHLARGRLAALEGQVERASEHAFAACGRSSAPELVLDRLERLAPGLDLAPLREACRTSP